MNIRNVRELKTFAAQRLSHAQNEKRIAAIYAGLILGMAALVTVVNFVLGLQIDNFGGLGNMGTRTILSSVQSMTPIAQSLVTMCLDVGYLAAMLRIARGQYVSPQTLRLGFDRFWVLLRCTLVKSLIYFAIAMVSVYLGIMIYMMTPLSDAAVEVIMPLLSETSLLNSGFVVDDATYAQLTGAMVPAFVICGVIFCAAAAPVMYSYRMANYVIIDRPGMGAMAALRESKKMMKGNRIALLRMDLSFWWYYVVTFAATIVCYGDLILPMLGETLPLSADVGYFVFLVLYLALMFGIYYFLRNRVETAYGLAYDAVKPQEKQDGGVVLGNIFNM